MSQDFFMLATFGRNLMNDIVVNDKTVSNFHG